MKPILFNTEMVRAILDDRKTVTRRVVRLKYSNTHLEMFTNKYGTRLIEKQNFEPGVTIVKNPDGSTTRKLLACIEKTPPYRPGDILYIPQAWKCVGIFGELGYEVEFQDGQCVKFKFESKERAKKWAKYRDKPACHWQSPYFMPREAARLFLRVTDVRVERLQDITQYDAIQEGIDRSEIYRNGLFQKFSPKAIFRRMWDSTIKKPANRALYGWAANPWVWVVAFERCEKRWCP